MSQKDPNNIKDYFEKQFKVDLFSKLDFPFEEGKSLLDAGCGDAVNSDIFQSFYKLKLKSFDLYEHQNIKKFQIDFRIGSVLDIPFADNTFDYVYLQDVLHHIDEENQDRDKHIKALYELKRVVKPGGYVIIVEAKRYNPMFYPFMVKYLGHDHFTHGYYKKLVSEAFSDCPEQLHKSFEAHFYFSRVLSFWKLYERFMEKYSPVDFLAYNASIIKKPL